MRHLATLFIFAAMAPMSSAARGPFDPTTEYLLTSAATDFRAHGPGGALRFRDVHRVHVTLNAGTEQQMLCGDYSATTDGKVEWISFATVKTSGYEQWNGIHAGTFCLNPKAVADKDHDLTSELQSRFDALK